MILFCIEMVPAIPCCINTRKGKQSEIESIENEMVSSAINNIRMCNERFGPIKVSNNFTTCGVLPLSALVQGKCYD